MQLKPDLSEIRTTLTWLGFNVHTGKYNLKVVIFLILVVFLTVNSIIDLVSNWRDIDIRVDGLKGLIDYLFFTFCLSSIVLNWKKAISLVDIIEDRFYMYPFQATHERLKLEDKILDELKIVHSIWCNGRPVYAASEIFPPIIFLIYRLITNGIFQISSDMMFTTHRYYCPTNNQPLLIYFIALFLQTSLYLYIVRSGYVVLSSAFLSMYKLAGEMRLLALSVDQMDKIILGHMIIDSKEFIPDNKQYKLKQTTKRYLNYLINHHQHLYRKAECVNQGIQMFAFYLNSGIAMLLVTAIYVMVQRVGMMGKIQEALYSFFMLLCSYFYNAMGQEVIVQDENLRKSFYNGQWLDKPNWFKKSFQIMMTRATKPIQMKPLGLFVLNLQNFLTLLKAVYSLYNVLNNFKDADN